VKIAEGFIMMKVEESRAKQQSKTEMALRLLIESNLAFQSQEPAIESRESVSSRNYIEEFCTVKMSSCRRAGHTSSILTLGQEMFVNPLFVCVNKRMVEYLEDILVNKFSIDKRAVKDRVVRPKDLLGNKKRVTFDAILVDNYSELTKEEENLVIDYAEKCFSARKYYFCLVFVG